LGFGKKNERYDWLIGFFGEKTGKKNQSPSCPDSNMKSENPVFMGIVANGNRIGDWLKTRKRCNKKTNPSVDIHYMGK
jgi:hypothetical protein